MPGTEVERRLSVILAADVVGYSRLMEADEESTVLALNHCRESIDACVTSHHGRIFGSAGDSVVAEFSSPIEAMRCAVTIQENLASTTRNFSGEPCLQYRIGINLGDVVVDGGNLLGDGVNIAARLESIADPGGITLSRSVYDQVKKHFDLEFVDLGEQNLKNISEAVQTFKVALQDQESIRSPGTASKTQPDHQEKPSVAVLPFANMSNDPEQDYFSDGITEDIITELSHFSGLSVTARNSSFMFRGDSIDIQEVRNKLNVRYVLEGSIRKSGRRVRVTAQLIDTETGTHVWADRYDRDLEDIFAVQDEVVRIISATLIGRVEHADHMLAKRKQPSSLEAYDCVVLGLYHFYKWTLEDNLEARKMFEQAIQIDPNYAPAYSWLAEAHFREGLNAWSKSHVTSFAQFYDYSVKAVALDDNDSRTHTSLGVAYLFRGEHDLAKSHLERSLLLNPSDTRALVHLARCEALSGNPSGGVDRLNEALRFNPLANYQWYAGQILYIAKQYGEAVNVLSSLSTPNALVHAFLAASHGQLGNTDFSHQEASTFIAKAEDLITSSGAPYPTSWIDFVVARYPFKLQSDKNNLILGLQKSGLS